HSDDRIAAAGHHHPRGLGSWRTAACLGGGFACPPALTVARPALARLVVVRNVFGRSCCRRFARQAALGSQPATCCGERRHGNYGLSPPETLLLALPGKTNYLRVHDAFERPPNFLSMDDLVH